MIYLLSAEIYKKQEEKMPDEEKTAGDGTPSICIVGAGPSGICVAALLRIKFNTDNFTIFEENEDVGGCWFANRYPGCECDIGSYLYSYSFEPNPYWSKAFAPQKEILEYLRSVARKHDIYSKTLFQHSVKLAKWDEESLKWNVTILDKQSGKETTRAFNIFVVASGVFRTPKIADHFNNFGGPVIHSAKWDESVELKDKVVAVVGSGASAAQIIPAIVKDVKTLLSYQRRPAWIMPKIEPNLPSWVKWTFAKIPGVQRTYRNLLFYKNEFRQLSFKADSFMQKMTMFISKTFMRLFIKDPSLQQKLTPNYPFGCKQIALSNIYYSALTRPNVKVIREEILEIRKDSIITNDGCEKPEVLILATGFEVQDHFAPMRIIGVGGQDVWKDWKETRPNLYYGSVCSKMPNAFFILGPNTGIAHNSAMFVMECQTSFMIQVLKEIEQRNCKKVIVKKIAEEVYMKWLDEDLKKSAFQATDCNSWHADEKGVVTSIWPHSLSKYYQRTKKVNFDRFEFY